MAYALCGMMWWFQKIVRVFFFICSTKREYFSIQSVAKHKALQLWLMTIQHEFMQLLINDFLLLIKRFKKYQFKIFTFQCSKIHRFRIFPRFINFNNSFSFPRILIEIDTRRRWIEIFLYFLFNFFCSIFQFVRKKTQASNFSFVVVFFFSLQAARDMHV